jgi:hypothetical protein
MNKELNAVVKSVKRLDVMPLLQSELFTSFAQATVKNLCAHLQSGKLDQSRCRSPLSATASFECPGGLTR